MENKKNNIKGSKTSDKKVTKVTNSKVKIKDKKKFIIALSAIIVLLLVLVLIIVSLNSKEDISRVENYSNLNTNKYSKELFEEYNKKESKERFLSDHDLVQGAVGLYIMNNSTLDNNSFESIIENLKEILQKEEWSKLDIEEPKYWNGVWSVTDDGMVKFKFNHKDIEPNWINDEELTNKINYND